MKFYHQGSKKKSNEPGVLGGCLLLICFGAIIYLLTLLDSLEDASEYWWQILLAFVMGISFFASFFAKRATLFNHHIQIKNDTLNIEKLSIPISKLTLDIYSKNGSFRRYHLYDEEGKIAIYSVLKDDFFEYFKESHSELTQNLNESSSRHDGPYVSVLGNPQALRYNLETGAYTITKQNQTEVSFLPQVYSYDPKYKLGKPLIKRKK